MNTAVAITDNAVWISDQDGYVARLDLRARDRVGRINVHKGITWIAAGAGAIWITVPG